MPKRELFLKIMDYEKVDHVPVIHWAGWQEFNEMMSDMGVEIHQQHEYFQTESYDQKSILDTVNSGLFPAFEAEVFEETDEYRIVRDIDGVIVKDFKHKSSIPQHIEYGLKGRGEIDEYLKRLQYSEERLPQNWSQIAQEYGASDNLIIMYCGSMMGCIRNWMGVEGLAMTLYDDPDMIRELVDATSDMVCRLAERVLKDVQVDVGFFWEDMSFKNGPLVSPKHFREIAGPGYTKITDTMKNLGVKHFMVDSDGVTDSLVPIWLENGVDILFPFEVGSWNADPMDYRKKYGKDLRILGGIDKSIVTKGSSVARIDKAIEQRMPLIKDGGYIPMPDHLMPPDTDIDLYKYYIDKIRNLRF